jgi:hypothetical protein
MAFLFGSKRCKCQIQILIRTVEAQCSTPTEFFLVFERGP